MTKSVTPAPSGARPLIAYATCADPQLAIFDADLTAEERVWLSAVLDRLADLGAITLPDLAAEASAAAGLPGILRRLRETIGTRLVDAAIGAAAYPASPTEAPSALIPLTAFEPAASPAGALIAYGQLFGHNLVLEAYPVQADDDLTAVGSPSRFDRWCAGAVCCRPLGTLRLPGRPGAYAVFAAVRAS